jgi:hypothetical protein
MGVSLKKLPKTYLVTFITDDKSFWFLVTFTPGWQEVGQVPRGFPGIVHHPLVAQHHRL